MKKGILWLLALLLVLSGCTQTPSPSVSSSSPQSPTDVVSVVSKGENEPLILELPLNQQWTWNDLYDYLENPRQSGTLAFDEEKGERVALLDVDGKTALSNQWNLPLIDNMTVIKYNAGGEIIGQYQIRLVGEAFSVPTKPSVSSTPSKTSSKPQPDIPTVSAPQKEEKTLVTLYWQGESAALTAAVEQFNKQSQTVEVLPVIVSSEITAERLSQWEQQKSAPDLLLLNHREVSLASEKKQLYNLSSLSVIKKVDSSFRKAVTKEKKVYGLPIGGVTACLACNEELLYRADATVPTTYEELIENAKRLRDNLTGVIPIGLTTDIADAASMAEEFALFLQGEEGVLFTPDYQSAAFYSKAGIGALTHYQTLVEEKLIADYVVRKDLLGQKIGYGLVSSLDYEKTFGKKAKANFTAAPIVTPGTGKASPFMEVYSFCLPAKGEKKAREGALEFLSFFYSNPEYSVELCQAKGWIPAQTKAMEHEAYQTEAWQVLIATAKTAVVSPPIACYPTIETYLAECVSSVITGNDKEQALEKAWNKTENRLARE